MVFEIIFNAMDVLFSPLLGINPVYSILILAIIISLITTVAQKLLVDQDRLQYLQKEMKSFQQEMMEARKTNDPKAMAKMQKKQMEFMDIQKEMMFSSFKPMIVTMAPILVIFWWLSQQHILNKTIVVLPKVAYYVLLVPLWHALPFYGAPTPGAPEFSIGWIGWYILCSFGLSILFRKFMGIKSGPS